MTTAIELATVQWSDIPHLVELARPLPIRSDDAINKFRILWCLDFGHLLILRDGNDGHITGYAELYLLNDIPDYPVKPLPMSEDKGRFLYCYVASCEDGKINALTRLAFERFPQVNEILYHRIKRGVKLVTIKRKGPHHA